jgi:hypothetical protein
VGEPYDVIAVAEVEGLLVLVLYNSNTSNEEDYLPRCIVEEVIATLVASISVNPLESELGVSDSLGHGEPEEAEVGIRSYNVEKRVELIGELRRK